MDGVSLGRSFWPGFFIVVFALYLQGCAVLGSKTNADKMAALSGEEFVLSTGVSTVDFGLLLAAANPPNTVLSLVPEQDQATVSGLHRGSISLTRSLTINDSSSAIASSLAKYYQKKYQTRFIAKGTIRNISPDYLKRALNKGRYVLDVRLVELTLNPDTTKQRFYPSGTYQLSVIDAQKAKVIIEDQCQFADVANQQRLSAFSVSNGKMLSDFLTQHANDCLKYFALGEPQPEVTGSSAPVEVEKPKPVAVQRTASQSTASISLGASYQLTKDSVDVSHSLQGYNATYQLNKPITTDQGFVFQSELSALGQNDWTDFSAPIVVTSIGAGVSFESQKYSDVRYALLATAKLGQYRQYLLSLSTKSLGVEAQVMKVFFDSIVLTGRYGFDQHIGQTKVSNSAAHLFGVSLGYQYGR